MYMKTGKFRIEFEYPWKENSSSVAFSIERLRNYPTAPVSIEIESFSRISFYFNGVLNSPPWAKPGTLECTDTEYLSSVFRQMLRGILAADNGQDQQIRYIDDPTSFYFRKNGPDVEIRVVMAWKQEADYPPPKTSVPWKTFVTECVSRAEEFVGIILEINPKLKSHQEVVELLNGIKSIKEKENLQFSLEIKRSQSELNSQNPIQKSNEPKKGGYLEEGVVEKIISPIGYGGKYVFLRIFSRPVDSQDSEEVIKCFYATDAEDIAIGAKKQIKLVLDKFCELLIVPNKKTIHYLETNSLYNTYSISGEVVARQGDLMVIDCGLYVFAKDELKKHVVGDLINAEARINMVLMD
jgi:hypothetical protein